MSIADLFFWTVHQSAWWLLAFATPYLLLLLFVAWWKAGAA